MPENNSPHDIFISYSRKNKDLVLPIKEELESALGLRCWIDLSDIPCGSENFKRNVIPGIKQTRIAFLFFLTAESQTSEYAMKEINFARKRAKKRIILIRINDADMTDEFAFDFQDADVIDWRQPEQKAKLLRDLRAWADEANETREPRSPAATQKPSAESVAADGGESAAMLVRRLEDAALADEKVEAEKVFLSRARRFKTDDGVIDPDERKELDSLAERLGISILRREALIEQVECALGQKNSAVQGSGSSFLPSSGGSAHVAVPHGSARFRLMAPSEITPQDIQEVLDMEAEVYPEEERQELSSCIQYFEVNPNVYLFFKDVETERIVANIDICPVTDECYEMIRSGAFLDREIQPDMVLSYDLPSLYNIYFEGITIRKEYRNTGLFLFMFNAVVRMFLSLGEREIFARRMIADAVTAEGVKFCKLFGMNKVKESDHQSTLYEVSLLPPRFRISSKPTKILHDYYAQKYDEVRDFDEVME